jgi:very-short-patch-repair endonuclease
MPLRRIPKSRQALQRARQLRRTMTKPERALWQLLRDRRLAQLKFRRQQPVGNYIVDFFCEAVGLIIELDGSSHDGHAGYDLQRQAWLESQGLRLLRIANDNVFRDPESVVIGIARAARIDVAGWLKSGQNLVEIEQDEPSKSEP